MRLLGQPFALVVPIPVFEIFLLMSSSMEAAGEPNATTFLAPTTNFSTTNSPSLGAITKQSTRTDMASTPPTSTTKSEIKTVSSFPTEVQFTVGISSGSTPETKESSTLNAGVLIGVLAAIVLVVLCLIAAALIFRKYKLNETNEQHQYQWRRSRKHGSRSQTLTKTEDYDEVEANKATYVNLKKTKIKTQKSSQVALPVRQQSCVYSNEIVNKKPEENRDTPDGTYEKPDVNVYSYADVIF